METLGRGLSTNASREISSSLALFWKRSKVTSFKFYNTLERHMFLCGQPAEVHWKFQIEFSWGSLVLLIKRIVQKVCLTRCFLHGSGVGSTMCVVAWTSDRILQKVCNLGDCVSECNFCSLTFMKDTANWWYESWKFMAVSTVLMVHFKLGGASKKIKKCE